MISGGFARGARILAATMLQLATSACSTLPPGSAFPKDASRTHLSAQDTRLGAHFQQNGPVHEARSGFHVISVGVDGFLARIELIDAAERTLDLQYYIFRGDETGTLIREALTRAARRGVRIRVLVDDADTQPGDERIFALDAFPNVEVRIYNPWRYRGHIKLLRNIEFLTHHSRLDYRMHNKLLVADDAVALVGGRNIGDQYFQVDPESQFADDDVFTVGPTVRELEGKFDDFWNSDLSIPSAALGKPPSRGHTSSRPPGASDLHRAGFHYDEKLAAGEPFASLLDGRTALSWAEATVVCDTPDKKDVRERIRAGHLNYKPIAEAVRSIKQELLITSPYFVPSEAELQLLLETRAGNARLAILTNSLESAPELAAHAGYMHYRPALLRSGAELYEVRAQLESTRGSGQSKWVSESGNYALHGKILVFDRQRVYMGSMNFDRRSRYLNTEIGLIIDSPEISEQMAARFTSMTQLVSAYTVIARPATRAGQFRLAWKTSEHGNILEYNREPARSSWQRMKVNLLTLLPLDPEL
jgi:cardiolipin synthase C